MTAVVVARGRLAALVVLILAAAVAGSAEEEPKRQDAAEAVKEGDVTQWLQHYRRERGDGWSTQAPSTEPHPPPMPQQGEEAKAQQPAR